MFEFHFLCAGLNHFPTQSSSLPLHVRRTPDLRSLSNGRQVSRPQPGDGDKEAPRCLLTLEHTFRSHSSFQRNLPDGSSLKLQLFTPLFLPYAVTCCFWRMQSYSLVRTNMPAQSISRVWLFGDPMDCIPTRLLRPWDSPGKNTGVGCHFLFQGIFLIQGLNPCLLHWQVDSLTELPGKPKNKYPLP